MIASDTDSFSYSTLLKIYRKRRRLTQQALAEAIGVHRSTLVRWEQGDYLPESKTIVLELARFLHLDEQESRKLLEASLTALAPYWSVPLPRNPYFTGREAVLEALHAQLGIDQPAALTQSSALQGLGGIGKTQIALEYAYRYALDYRAVFWIGAETEEQMLSSFLRIASVLQLPERTDQDQHRVVASVQRWLISQNQWLLIWDNVEDLELLQRFLPLAHSGAILITTRCQILGTLMWGIDVLPMEQEEGILFLLRRAKVLAPGAAGEQLRRLAEKVSAQYTAATTLVEVLGGLPLALDQAGAYVEATQCGLPAYLELFRTRQAALLQLRGEGSSDHPASVLTTFMLALRATAARHPAVLDLLRVCALLQPDAIPEELFHQGGKHLENELSSLSSDDLAWNQVLALACGYSLLSRQPEQQTLSLHRLVQAILLYAMTEAEQQQWNKRVIAALNAVFPDALLASEYAVWKQAERLLPHALWCLSRTSTTADPSVFASLASKTAQYLRERGQYAQAEPLLLQALHLREQILGPDHPEIAPSLSALAALSWSLGRYAQAEHFLLRALHICEQALGPDHAEVARPLNNLGLIYGMQGKYEQAEPLLLRALDLLEQSLGAEHPLVASTLHNLADLSRDRGAYAQAVTLMGRVLHIREQSLGAEHPLVAYALYDLAEISLMQGEYAQADQLYQRALSIREQALGAEHPLVAESINGLADLHRERGNEAEAEALYQRALLIRCQRLGQYHPDTAQTWYGLAVLRQKQGRLSEALSFAERALTIDAQSLEEVHPRTVAVQALYDQLLREQSAEQNEAPCERNADKSSNALEDERRGEGISPALSPHSSSRDDSFQHFLDACCERHPRACCSSADLWQAYEQWAEAHQERYPLSRAAFTQQLKAAGCQTGRTNSARIWRGITLLNRESVTGSDRS